MSSRPHHSLGHPRRRDSVIIIFLCVASTIEIELKDIIIPGLGEGEDYWWPNPCLADEAVQCTVQYSTVQWPPLPRSILGWSPCLRSTPPRTILVTAWGHWPSCCLAAA